MMMMLRLPKPKKKIAQKQLELRGRLFPSVTEAFLWHRDTHDGFITIPRTLPLIMNIMDDMAGQPVGHTYLELWCRSFDEAIVTLSKPREVAFHSGFGGQRNESTWRQRLKAISKLEFVLFAAGSSGPYSYALLINPYLVLRRHFQAHTPGLRVDKYNALNERMIEIGANDMDLPDP
jgi:hypothetical protein